MFFAHLHDLNYASRLWRCCSCSWSAIFTKEQTMFPIIHYGRRRCALSIMFFLHINVMWRWGKEKTAMMDDDVCIAVKKNMEEILDKSSCLPLVQTVVCGKGAISCWNECMWSTNQILRDTWLQHAYHSINACHSRPPQTSYSSFCYATHGMEDVVAITWCSFRSSRPGKRVVRAMNCAIRDTIPLTSSPRHMRWFLCLLFKFISLETNRMRPNTSLTSPDKQSMATSSA